MIEIVQAYKISGPQPITQSCSQVAVHQICLVSCIEGSLTQMSTELVLPSNPLHLTYRVSECLSPSRRPTVKSRGRSKSLFPLMMCQRPTTSGCNSNSAVLTRSDEKSGLRHQPIHIDSSMSYLEGILKCARGKN